jgi:hypothetical protein
MKRYTFGIDKYQAEWIFAPIRSRQDALIILLKVVKILLLNQPPLEEQTAGQIVLAVSKMSRIFFVSEAKVYSLAFPFFVTEKDGIFSFKTHSHSSIDHRVSSDLLSLLEAPKTFSSNEVLEFAESIDDIAQFDLQIWALFRDLLMSEEGYIRYDYDEEHQNGHHHPINHFDVFFSNNSTFKLGLHSRTDINAFIDLLDSNTECHYVSVAPKAGR